MNIPQYYMARAIILIPKSHGISRSFSPTRITTMCPVPVVYLRHGTQAEPNRINHKKKLHSTYAYVDRRTSLVYTRQYTYKIISHFCIYTIVSSLLLELYNSHYLQYNIIYIINLLIQHQIISMLYIPNNHKYVIKLGY